MKRLFLILTAAAMFATGCSLIPSGPAGADLTQYEDDFIPLESEDGVIFYDTSTGRKAAGSGIYDDASAFFNGYAVVKDEDKGCYLIDKNFDKVSDNWYEISCVGDGIALAASEFGHIVALTPDGRELFEYEDAEQACTFIDGVSIFYNDEGYYGLKDKKGNNVVEPDLYTEMQIPVCGLIPVGIEKKSGTKYGVIGTDGKEVLPCEYDGVVILRDYVSKGYFLVESHGKCGIIDRKGNEIVSVEYSSVVPQKDGRFLVSKYSNNNDETRFGVIDVKGNEIIPLRSRYDNMLPFVDGVAPAKRKGQWGLIDYNEEWVLANKYKEIQAFSADGLAMVTDEDWECGIVNSKGEFVVKPRYEGIFRLSEKYYLTRNEDDEIGIITNAGEKIGSSFEAELDHDSYRFTEWAVVSDRYVDIDGIVNQLTALFEPFKSKPFTVDALKEKYDVSLSSYGNEKLCETDKSSFNAYTYAFVDYTTGYDFYKGNFTNYFVSGFTIRIDFKGKACRCEDKIYTELLSRFGGKKEFTVPGAEGMTFTAEQNESGYDIYITVVPKNPIKAGKVEEIAAAEEAVYGD